MAPHATPRRLLKAATLAAGLACLAPTAALADSIVYIDGGNVWSAEPDGSHRVQLTDGGGWHSPTQADDGTIAAVQGTGPIQVMTGDGRPLRTINTPPAPSGDGGTFAPAPKDLAFSPDGTKIAYAYIAYSCPVASTCGSIQRSTFYTEAGVTEATPHSVYGNQFGVASPSWVTGTRTLLSGGYGSQVAIDDLGPGDYSQTAWMVPDTDMSDPEVTRDGRRLAATYDYGDNTRVAFFAVNGDVRTETPPAQPDLACETTTGDSKHAEPTWSPDGNSVAYASSKGIEIGTFTRLDAGGCEVVPGDRILTPTGESPDWGPADPPAARWAPPAGQPQVPHTPHPPGEPTGAAITVATKKAGRAQLRRGLKVRITVPAAGRVTVRLGRIARGSAVAKEAGTVAVRLSKVPRRKAAKLRGRKLKLTIAQGAVRTTAPLRIR